jgi:hypothetical protein
MPAGGTVGSGAGNHGRTDDTTRSHECRVEQTSSASFEIGSHT